MLVRAVQKSSGTSLRAALGYALRTGQDGGAIVRRPYNNRSNDAAGAREDHFG